MTYKLSVPVLLLAVAFSVPFGWSQSVSQSAARPFGLVLAARGTDVSVYREGNLTDYDLTSTDVKGTPLFPGDLVQTGPRTTLEIQMLPGTDVLQVAENTTFRLVEQAGGGVQVVLTYGRVRVRGQNTGGSAAPGVSVKGGTLTAGSGAENSDFVYDVVAKPGAGTAPVTQVYCLQGSVAVSPVSSSAASAPRSIAAGSMITMTPPAGASSSGGSNAGGSNAGGSNAGANVPEPAPIPAADAAYWADHGPSSAPMSLAQARSSFPDLGSQVSEWDASHEAPSSPTVASAPTSQSTTSQSATVAPQATPPSQPPESSSESAAQAPPAGQANQSDTVLNHVLPKHESHTVRNIGLGISIGGVVAGAAGAVLYFFGPSIFPSLTPSTNTTISGYTLMGGGALLAGGILIYLVGEAIQR